VRGDGLGGTMELLLSHWHCIMPVIAIAVVLFLRGRKKDKE
jgi:hypothetical protein